MRDLLEHTQDEYEKQYGAEICSRFKGYREFWNRYIGQRKNNSLRHYEIDNSKTNIENFDAKYEKMTIIHYGIFVDLACIRIDFKALIKNPYESVEDKLEYWNIVRNIYSKMGDSIYKYKTFLDMVKDILNIGKALDKEIKMLKADLNSIKKTRDYQCHFTLLPFIEDKKGIYTKIPRQLYSGRKPLSYSEIRKQDFNSWGDVREQIKCDLDTIEAKFDLYHQKVLNLFEKYKEFKIIDPDSINHIKELSSASGITGISGFSGTSGDMSKRY